MLRRNGKDVKTHAFLCAIELEDDVDPAYVINKLGEGITWVEGVGTADIEHLGEIQTYDEEELEPIPDHDLDMQFLSGDVPVEDKEFN